MRPQINKICRPEPPKKMTKEEFMTQWVMLRASFREEFHGVSAVRAASDAWAEIQKLKDK